MRASPGGSHSVRIDQFKEITHEEATRHPYRRPDAGRHLAGLCRPRLPGHRARAQSPTEALVLPLDHGLRAQTTPQQNRLRMERYEAKLKACKNAAK